MTKRRRTAAVFALVLGLCWLFWLWGPTAPQAPTAPEPEPAELAAPPQPSLVRAPVTQSVTPKPEPIPAAPITPPPALPPPTEPAAPPQRIGHPMENENMPSPVAQGPVQELQTQFANESQATGSRAQELAIANIVAGSGAPPELLDHVLCRRTVCRATMHWTGARMISLLVAVGELRKIYKKLALSPAPEREPDNTLWVEVYVKIP